MILCKNKWYLLTVIFLLMLLLAPLTIAGRKQPKFDELVRDYIEKPKAEDLIKQLQDVIDELQTKLANKDINLNSDNLLLHALYKTSSPRLKMAAVAGLCENEFTDICVDAVNQKELRSLSINTLRYTPDNHVIALLIEVLRNKEWESFHRDAIAALSFRAVEFPEEATQIIQSAYSLVKDSKVPDTVKFDVIDKMLTMLSVEAKSQQANQALTSIMHDKELNYKFRFYAARALADSSSTETAEKREAARFCAKHYESFTLSEPILDIRLSPYQITSRSFVEIGRGYAVRNLQFKPHSELAMDVIGEVRIPAYKFRRQLAIQFAISLYDTAGKYLGGEQFYVYNVHPGGGIYPFAVSIINVASKSVEYCQIRLQGVWDVVEDKQLSIEKSKVLSTIDFESLD